MSSVPNGFAQSEARWGVYNSYRNYAKLKVCTIDLAKQLGMDWNFTCNLASLQHQAPRFRHTTSFPATFAKKWGKKELRCPSHQWMLPFHASTLLAWTHRTPKAGWMAKGKIHLKNSFQIRSFPQVGVKIKHVGNHHLVYLYKRSTNPISIYSTDTDSNLHFELPGKFSILTRCLPTCLLTSWSLGLKAPGAWKIMRF